MDKDFDAWNVQKKRIQGKGDTALFHEREIWWCAIGVNVGYEQDGKNDLFERPVLVVKKFNRDVLWILPLTRSSKLNGYYYHLAQGQETDSAVILSQIRLISSKRLLRKMRMIPEKEFEEIVARVGEFLRRMP